MDSHCSGVICCALRICIHEKCYKPYHILMPAQWILVVHLILLHGKFHYWIVDYGSLQLERILAGPKAIKRKKSCRKSEPAIFMGWMPHHKYEWADVKVSCYTRQQFSRKGVTNVRVTHSWTIQRPLVIKFKTLIPSQCRTFQNWIESTLSSLDDCFDF